MKLPRRKFIVVATLGGVGALVGSHCAISYKQDITSVKVPPGRGE